MQLSFYNRELLNTLLEISGKTIGRTVIMAKTRVFKNGKIYTVNKKQPWAEAVVTEDTKIVYVGDGKGAMAYAKDGAEVEDLGGRLMIPGIIDGHLHAVMSIVIRGLIRISPTADFAEMKKTIKDFIDAHPELKAYMGMGWNDAYFGETGPNKADLDEICSDKPIAVFSASGHCGWCNSKALELAGVNKDTPDPDREAGHLYYRDSEGNPTGYVKESMATNKILAAGDYIEESLLDKSTEEFLAECSELGLTSLVDCGNYDFGEFLMRDELVDIVGDIRCPVRLDCCGVIGNKQNIEFALQESKKLKKKYTTDRIRCTFLKILNDGTLENFSAAIPNAYPGADVVKPTMGVDELFHWGEEAAKAGLDLNVHAIGSLTVHDLLEAAGKLRAAGYNDMRIVCSHSAYVFPEDLDKFGKYNVVGNSTGRWFAAIADEKLIKMIDELTQAKAYPMKSIKNGGGKLSLSSDYPTDLTTFKPMPNVECAFTRQPEGKKDAYISQPDERLTIEDIIEAYTINNAYVMRMEDKIGSIEVGKYADMVVLEENLFEIDPYTIHDVKVHETIMDGITRFKRD